MTKSFELTRFEIMELTIPLVQIFRDGKPLSEERLNVYWKILKRFEYRILERSIEIIIEEKADQRFFPKPAEIIEMTHRAFQTREAGDTDILQYMDGREECSKCCDTGYVQKLVKHPKLHEAPYKTVTECTCERGQRIKENWKLQMRKKRGGNPWKLN